MVVVYHETGQITITPAHTGCVASSGSPYPLSATSMEQQHCTQSSFAITGGLWLKMRRRRESLDPSDDDISREMQMHEGDVCQQSLQLQESWIDVHRSGWLFGHLRRLLEQVGQRQR